MNVRRPLQQGVLLTALGPGAMALAQEQGKQEQEQEQEQQMPMMGQGMHDTMGQQTKQGDGGARYGPRYDARSMGPRTMQAAWVQA